MNTWKNSVPRTTALAAVVAIVLGVAGCGGGGGGGGGTGGGGGGGNAPTAQRAPNITGVGTSVAHVNYGETFDQADVDDNLPLQAGLISLGLYAARLTAPGAEASWVGLGTVMDSSDIETLRRVSQGNHIVAFSWTPQTHPRNYPAFRSMVQANPNTLYIAQAKDHDPLDPFPSLSSGIVAYETAQATNGIAAAAVENDRGRSSVDNCSDLTVPDGCINVNLTKGHPDAGRFHITDRHSVAAAKLAGYAALLREAFNPLNGAMLAQLITDGANDANVFSLNKALERAGLADIGIRYINVMEPDSGGVFADEVITGWTAMALVGPGAALPLVRNGDDGGVRFAAFATPDQGASAAAPRVAGFAAGWRGLRWGALAERDGFLGRPARSLLGASRGRWTWLGWSGEARAGAWRFGTGLEMGLGTADAGRSEVVADYGTIVTSAWRAEAEWAGEGLSAALSLHQPPRTERARFRLRHGEGTVREGPGREVRLTARLAGAGGWRLSLAAAAEPGHDARRRTETELRAGWRISW